MALYKYQALSKDGKRVSGTLDAGSLKQVHDHLSAKNLFPITITAASEATAGFSLKNLFERKISLKEKLFFTKQLQVLLKSGVPLPDALELLVQQSEGQLKNIVVSLRDGIKEGKSLADGLALYPKTFEVIYVQLVRAGEASGQLDLVLSRLTSYFERRDELRSKIKGALTYPIIQLVIITAVTAVLLGFVVPQMKDLFDSMGEDLPLATKMIIALSNFLQHYYLYLIMSVVSIYIAYRFWKATPNGARTIDAIKLKIPIVGYFARMGAVAQFCSTLGMLLEGGVGLPESLDIVSKIVDNKILISALQEAREKIIKQGQIAQYLKQTGIFPPTAIYLINTGEQSGQLPQMLNQVAQTYEKDLLEYSDGLTAKLNPIMLVLMAVIVGFIMLAIMGPIMGMDPTKMAQGSKSKSKMSRKNT